MSECVFCKIVNGDFNTEFIYEDEFVAVFKDINPVAPVHLLAVPKNHVESLKELTDEEIMSALLCGAKKACEKINIKDYRIVINTGKPAGQEVMHLHLHIIAGRKLNWPPG